MSGLTLTVLGTPRPQPRPRFVRGRVVSTASRAVASWRSVVTRAAASAVENLGGRQAVRDLMGPAGVSIAVRFTFGTVDAARHGKPHAQRPDGDNLAKLVMDCLGNAGALGGDDAAAASLSVSKVWGAVPGVVVVVSPLDGPKKGHSVQAGGSVPGWLSGGVG